MGLAQFPVVVIGLAALLAWPLGIWMYRAMEVPEGTFLARAWDPVARLLGRDAVTAGQDWKQYSIALLVFNAVMFAFGWAVLAFQHVLPLNPDARGPIDADLIFNTVSSFVTNTNLQHYSGEKSLSYLSQLFNIAWLQFVSPAVGLAALAAIARGLAGRSDLGNFFGDLVRGVLFVFIPLAFVLGVALILAGMPMTFSGAAVAHTVEGAVQTIARGPVAAIVAIKQLGTNGGGFFGSNSTHPFENPNGISNILEAIAIIVLPMAQVWTFGRIIGRMRHAAVLWGVMFAILVAMIATAVSMDARSNAAFRGMPVADGLNLEGKELRFGDAAGPAWAAMTTATSNGSVNSVHDSLNPLAGLVPLVGMWLNEAFGGVGVGLVNMILYIIVAVFVAGMMVGRTPEYLARKVEAREMKLALVALLLQPFLILGGAALFAATPWGAGTVANPGAHGFSEILYEFSSAFANNGSGFEGLGDDTVPWNVATGIVMLLGRFIPIIAPIAIAGFLSVKKAAPETAGTFRTDGLTFGLVLLGTVLLVGALLFLPVAVLGPIAEHLTLAGN